MDPPPVFTLALLSDSSHLPDLLRGILHTIFFHRFFSSFRPFTRDLLDITLPSFNDPALDTVIESRLRTLEGDTAPPQVAVCFYEKKARKASWFAKEEKVCWEQWVINITLVAPRTEAERAHARRQIEDQLQATILKIIAVASAEKNHVPPITTNDANPFPYTIALLPKGETWGTRMGIF